MAMSELETSQEAASPAEAELDELSITSSLSRLQEMHIAVCHSPPFPACHHSTDSCHLHLSFETFAILYLG